MEHPQLNTEVFNRRFSGLERICKYTPESKRAEREELARLQEEFFASGGVKKDCDISTRTEPKKFGESRLLRGRTNG